MDYANYYQGLWDCEADEPDELAFQRGDLIYIVSKVSINNASQSSFIHFINMLHIVCSILIRFYSDISQITPQSLFVTLI